jgi:hypothetical protein
MMVGAPFIWSAGEAEANRVNRSFFVLFRCCCGGENGGARVRGRIRVGLARVWIRVRARVD